MQFVIAFSHSSSNILLTCAPLVRRWRADGRITTLLFLHPQQKPLNTMLGPLSASESFATQPSRQVARLDSFWPRLLPFPRNAVVVTCLFRAKPLGLLDYLPSRHWSHQVVVQGLLQIHSILVLPVPLTGPCGFSRRNPLLSLPVPLVRAAAPPKNLPPPLTLWLQFHPSPSLRLSTTSSSPWVSQVWAWPAASVLHGTVETPSPRPRWGPAEPKLWAGALRGTRCGLTSEKDCSETYHRLSPAHAALAFPQQWRLVPTLHMLPGTLAFLASMRLPPGPHPAPITWAG